MSTGEAADEHFVYEYNCGLWQGGLTSEFPRRDYHLSVGCFGFPPYGPGQGKREVVWAARRASLSWCSLMLEEAERTGIPEDEIRVAVDDTCFALAVFDKVWETFYFQSVLDAASGPSSLPTLMELAESVEVAVELLYQIAIDDRLPVGHTPPPFQEVHKLVLTWLLLWIDKRFVCDPPKVNHHAFDVRTLGKYSARYHELSLLRTESSDDNPNGIKAERLVFPAQEWTPGVLKPVSQPITKPWTHDRGAASTSKLQVDCNNANVENKPSSGTSTPKSSKKAAKPTVRDLGDLLRPARAVRPAPAHHRAD